MVEQKQNEAEVAKIDEALGGIEKERQKIATRVEPVVLTLYQKLIATKAGVAIAEARGESCSGCYMSIPPQVYVNVKKNASVITCPNCNRILYFKEAVAQQ